MKALFSTVAKTAGSVSAETARIIMAMAAIGLDLELLAAVLDAPEEGREPQDQQGVADDRPGDQRLHQVVRPLLSAKSVMMSFRGVPERRVEQPPQGLPQPGRRVLRAEPDPGRQRDERQRRGREDRPLRRIQHPAHDRGRQPQEENAHPRTAGKSISQKGDSVRGARSLREGSGGGARRGSERDAGGQACGRARIRASRTPVRP